MVARYRATLAYDGSAFYGFQRQAGGLPTVQAAVEQAVLNVTRQRVSVIGAGRTDTGVHAEGQVISFDVVWPHGDDRLLRALNACLPHTIALQDIRQHQGFHPRFDAVARLYRYTIVQAAQRQPLVRERAWQLTHALDLESMSAAAALLKGVHDFGAFGTPPYGKNTVREVLRSEWTVTTRQPALTYHYHVEANAFLQHMVRRIVGVLVRVGQARLSLAQFHSLLKSSSLAGGVTLAPPYGLVLEAVRYPDDDLIDRRGRRPLEDYVDE
jgi:tRNA pseudouridine38-40 synthase